MNERTPWGSTSRYFKNIADAAIANDLTAGLIELISNSDDSYHRLEEDGKDVDGRITIHYKPSRTKDSELIVVDFAEGMSKGKIEKIMKFGGKTSGQNTHNVRGVFGRGLKDAIIALSKEAYIYSIYTKENEEKLTVYRLFPDTQEKSLVLNKKTNKELLKKYKMTNGKKTMIRLVLKDSVTNHRVTTLKEALQNHFLLRKIMEDRGRKVILKQSNKNEKYVLRKDKLEGERWKEDWGRSIPGFKDCTFDISIYISEEPLNQKGNDRDGGLLIMSGNSVHDCTLFGYEEEATRKIFGEINCKCIDEMLYEDIMVVKPDRSGLDDKNDFVQALKKEVRNYIKPLVKKLRKEYRLKSRKISTKNERKEFKKAVKKINEITKGLTEDELMGDTPRNKGSRKSFDMPEDIEFTSNYYPRIDNKKMNIYVKVNSPEIIPTWEIIRFTCENEYIEILDNDIKAGSGDKVTNNSETYFKVGVPIIGRKTNEEGKITAKVKDKNGDEISTDSLIKILPPAGLPENGIGFKKDIYKIKKDKINYMKLLIDNNLIKKDTCIKIEIENEMDFILRTDKINVKKSDKRIQTKKISIEGKKLGEETKIIAKLGIYKAETKVVVVSTNEDKDTGDGFIKDIGLSNDEANQRRGFENGIITIFLTAPIVQKYEKMGRDSPEFKILKAELITQTWAEELAKLRVEKGWSIYSTSRNKMDGIELEKNTLEKEYSHIIHSIFIDMDINEEGV